jgi:hypothetical protein
LLNAFILHFAEVKAFCFGVVEQGIIGVLKGNTPPLQHSVRFLPFPPRWSSQ